MTTRGWVSLDRVRHRAEAQQPAPLVWPPALAATNDAVCHSARLNLAQVDKAQEEGFAIDQARRCITREAMAEREATLRGREVARQRREAHAAEQDVVAQLALDQGANGGRAEKVSSQRGDAEFLAGAVGLEQAEGGEQAKPVIVETIVGQVALFREQA